MSADGTQKTPSENDASEPPAGSFTVEELVNSLPADVQRKLRNSAKETSSNK